MRVIIIGGGGMLGRKLARALGARGEIGGREISHLALADIVDPAPVEAPFPVTTHRLDITDRAAVDALLAEGATGGAEIIYHLAAIVSAQSESEFDLGMRVNLMGSINVFEAARALGTCPKLVFTSSNAVYGGDIPEMIEDWTALNPQTSYGAEKAAAEMLLTDFSRRGFLIHAAEVPAEALGMNRCFALPGRTHLIGDMVEAMRRVAGDAPVGLIRWEPDRSVQKIVLGWKAHFNPAKALALGFVRDDGFEDNIRFFLEDDIER